VKNYPNEDFTVDESAEKDVIDQHLTLFKNYDTLLLKDYSLKHKEDSNNSYIKVVLNNKSTVTVRKSSLCWFFMDKNGRLSSDRIHRVKGENKISTLTKRKQKRTQKNSKSSATPDNI